MEEMAEGKGPEGKRDGKWQMGRWQREAGGGGGGDWEWRMEWRERLLGSGGTIGRGPDSGERQCLR